MFFGYGAERVLRVIMVSMAQRFPRFSDRRFPVFRFPYTVCLTTYEKDFSLRSKRRCRAWLSRPARIVHKKRRCEITIISFSRSICRGGLAALIGVTGKPYPSCLSCHSHPIRPCGHLPLEGKAAIREYHLLKKAAKPPPEP